MDEFTFEKGLVRALLRDQHPDLACRCQRPYRCARRPRAGHVS